MAVRWALPLCRADRIQFYLCGAALGGGTYARASQVDSTNRKILQNHVSVSIRESDHGALVHREQTLAMDMVRLLFPVTA